MTTPPVQFFLKNHKILLLISFAYYLLTSLFLGCGFELNSDNYIFGIFKNIANSPQDVIVLVIGFLVSTLAICTNIYLYISSKTINQAYGRFIIVMYTFAYLYHFFDIDISQYSNCINSDTPYIYVLLPFSIVTLPYFTLPLALLHTVVLFIFLNDKMN